MQGTCPLRARHVPARATCGGAAWLIARHARMRPVCTLPHAHAASTRARPLARPPPARSPQKVWDAVPTEESRTSLPHLFKLKNGLQSLRPVYSLDVDALRKGAEELRQPKLLQRSVHATGPAIAHRAPGAACTMGVHA